MSAWWWNGAAGLGSLCPGVLDRTARSGAWRSEHGFYTAGDFLEFRYGPAVRAVVGVAHLGRHARDPRRPADCGRGSAERRGGGLQAGGRADRRRADDDLLRRRRPAELGVGERGSARGPHRRFRWSRCRCSVSRSAGLSGVGAVTPPHDGYWDIMYSAGAGFGLGDACASDAGIHHFPGLLQKVYGAKDERAVRVGVGRQARRADAVRLHPRVFRHCARLPPA